MQQTPVGNSALQNYVLDVCFRQPINSLQDSWALSRIAEQITVLSPRFLRFLHSEEQEVGRTKWPSE
jgi:hypothetical protein